MYKTNLRDIRFPTENAPIILKKGLITKDDFARSNYNVILRRTPYAIAKRIFVWTDIEVITADGWTLVGNGDYKALEKAYTHSDIVKDDNADTPIMHYCWAKEPKHAESSVPESTPEVIEEPVAEEVKEEIVVDEEPSSEEAESEVQEEIVEDSIENENTTPEEVIDQPTEEVVEDSESVVEEQPVENVPVAVPVNPQQNTQNYTRINNKRNKHNRR